MDRSNTRSVVIATGILALCLAPVGVAATGDSLREGTRNGTATKETEIVANVKDVPGPKGGYSTRQSNLSATGGGAIYGCRASAAPGSKPCLRVNNLADGLAFEYYATKGNVVGTITAQGGGDAKKPFTTNATGVATGLNADRVDGQNADDIVNSATSKSAADATTKANGAKTRWVLVGPDGSIVQQTGGFKLVNCYQANANCYIDAGEDVTNNAISTEIVTANNPDAGADGQLSGSSSSSPCFFDFVNCGPAGTDKSNGGNAGVFVVTPRNADGTDPGAGDRYPFYAYVSDSESQ